MCAQVPHSLVHQDLISVRVEEAETTAPSELVELVYAQLPHKKRDGEGRGGEGREGGSWSTKLSRFRPFGEDHALTDSTT